MPGFNIDPSGSTQQNTMYADNVDFTGGAVPTPRVNSNGQLLIGSGIAPHIAVGMLTSPDGSITFGYSSPNITAEVSALANYISLSPFIVGTDLHSGYGTIQAGINAAVAAGATASSAQNVYIKPKADGTSYTENLILASGVNLIAFPGYQQQGLTKFFAAGLNVTDSSVNIIGAHTLPTGGNVRIRGITFSGFGTLFTGVNTPDVYFQDCAMVVTTHIFSLKTGAALYIENCVISTVTNWISFFDDDSTYNIQIINSDISETTTTTALGSGSTVVYDISNSNYKIHKIDSTNSAAFGFAMRNSYLINESAVTPFIIGTTTVMAGQIPGLYLNKVVWNMTGLDSTHPIVTNSTNDYTVTLEDCYLQGTGSITLDNQPFPTSGPQRYINCKVFYGNNASFYVMDLLSSTSFGFNASQVFRGSASVQTLDASVTVLYGAPIQDASGNNAVSFCGTVTGSSADFTDIFVGQFMVVGSRVGAANITITTPMINISTTSTATMTITADTAHQSIALYVAGLIGTVYNWTVDFHVQYVPGSS